MLINRFLDLSHKSLRAIYEKSILIQNIDWLILFGLFFLVFSSLYAHSDSIGFYALFIIILTGVKLLFKPNEKFILTLADKFLLIYFLFVLISVAGSSLLGLSLKGFCKTIIYLGFYISFVHYLKDNKDKLKYILMAIALAVMGEFLVSVKQNFLSVAEISGWQDMSRLNPEQIMTRVYGTLKPYNPNLFGGYMLSILPTTLVLIFLPLINKHYKTAIFGFACFLFGVVTILMTGCRGAYMGLFVEILLIILLTYNFLKPVYKRIYITITSFCGLLACLFIISKASLRARILSIFAMRSDSSNSFRFNVYNSCLEMFKDNWLLGIGVGNQNFREIYGLYMKTGFDALSAYNIYLETAVESGIFALLAFLFFISLNLYKAINYILKRKNIVSIYLLISIVSILGMLTHGMVDTVFFRPQIQIIFWIMMGIITVLTYSRRNYAR